MISFKVGHCLACGKQALIQNTTGRPIGGLPGAKLCWIKLTNDAGDPVTRVGHINLCPNCDPASVDLGNIKQVLFKTRTSGVTGKEPEWKMLPIHTLEVHYVFPEAT